MEQEVPAYVMEDEDRTSTTKEMESKPHDGGPKSCGIIKRLFQESKGWLRSDDAQRLGKTRVVGRRPRHVFLAQTASEVEIPDVVVAAKHCD